MKNSSKVLFTCVAVVLTLLLITNPRAFAQADDGQDCTTMAVGIAASTTGEVIVAHNEDDGGRSNYSQMYVPRMFHAPGSFVNGGNLGPGMAQIPDVPETYAYYWSDAITSPSGAANADVMQNEFGVTVASNAMSSKETCTTTCLVNGGIDYGLNTIVIQRATSARNGVEIAAALVSQWGYNSNGRAYMIADAKEAWSFQIVKGMHYVAQRVGDNEVQVIANRYTIRHVDMVDATTTHTKFYASPDLVTYAIAKGWYTPAVPSNYSDFDFAPVYASSWPIGSQDAGNTIRMWHAYVLLTGLSWQNDPQDLPFSVAVTRQLGVADLQAAERTHYEGTADDKTNGYTSVPSTPHYTTARVICTSTTMESTIWQLRPNPLFDVMWRTTLRPEGPYIPWYPQPGTLPNNYSFTTPVYAQTTHFTPAVKDFQYTPSRAYWLFSDLQNLIDPMYGQVISQEVASRNVLEEQWFANQAGTEATAWALYSENPIQASAFLAAYTNQAASEAWSWARSLYLQLAPVTVQIMSRQISKTAPAGSTVSVAIFSNPTFNATLTDPASISMGVGYKNSATYAKPISVVPQALTNDGLTDLVATFTTASIVSSSGNSGGATTVNVQELFLQGNNNGKIFVGETIVNIVP